MLLRKLLLCSIRTLACIGIVRAYENFVRTGNGDISISSTKSVYDRHEMPVYSLTNLGSKPVYIVCTGEVYDTTPGRPASADPWALSTMNIEAHPTPEAYAMDPESGEGFVPKTILPGQTLRIAWQNHECLDDYETDMPFRINVALWFSDPTQNHPHELDPSEAERDYHSAACTFRS